jgi:hypothetical protein
VAIPKILDSMDACGGFKWCKSTVLVAPNTTRKCCSFLSWAHVPMLALVCTLREKRTLCSDGFWTPNITCFIRVLSLKQEVMQQYWLRNSNHSWCPCICPIHGFFSTCQQLPLHTPGTNEQKDTLCRLFKKNVH